MHQVCVVRRHLRGLVVRALVGHRSPDALIPESWRTQRPAERHHENIIQFKNFGVDLNLLSDQLIVYVHLCVCVCVCV